MISWAGMEGEFLVPPKNPSYAPGRAEEIHKSNSNRPMQTAKGPLTLTMSFGVLLRSEWGQKPVEELLHEVDIALYEAKAAGRDCLRMAQPGGSGPRDHAASRAAQALRKLCGMRHLWRRQTQAPLAFCRA
jgi:predicted signal transduction protein with EAL and GGDEF domain